MRKFMQFRSRTSSFRSLLILATAFALLAAFAPRANATLIRFYDFETPPGGTVTPPYLWNLQSHQPAAEQGGPNVPGQGTTLFLDNGIGGVAYNGANTSIAPGIPLNVPSGALPNLTAAGFDRSGLSNLGVEIPMPSSQGIYDVTSVSFAYGSNGNGWSAVQLQMSTDGGHTFTTNLSAITPLPATPGSVISFTIPSGTTTNINNLVLRLLFTGGQSNGTDLQFELDNIQIGGTITPEPATVAGGLLGVLGLCWFQRKRLIRSVRFRRT